MDNQEVYDKVKTHLLSQGMKAYEGSMCKYRQNSLKCAIGCLIPDDLYSINMEERTVRSLIQYYPNLPFSYINIDFLSKLQWIHDSVPVTYWKDELKSLARKYNLYE